MAFNNLQPPQGPFFLAPGASTRIWVRLGGGTGDRGAQWIMAHPIQNGQPPTELVLSDFSKALDYGIGWVRSDGHYGYDPQSAYYVYRVTVTNRGREGTLFNVQGGGNV